jgi:hypothetical protein
MQMKLSSKIILSKKLLLFATIYFATSFASIFLIVSGYKTLFFIFGVAPLYLIIWILLVFAALSSRRLRYIPILAYSILLTRLILASLDMSSVYIGDTSLWTLISNAHLWVLVLYDALLILFTIGLFRLKSMHPEDRH